MTNAENRLAQMRDTEPFATGPVEQIMERGRKRKLRRRRIEIATAVCSAIVLVSSTIALTTRSSANNGLLLGSDGGQENSTTTLAGPGSRCPDAPPGTYPPTGNPTHEGEQAAAVVREVTGQAPILLNSKLCAIEMTSTFGDIALWYTTEGPDGSVAEGSTAITDLPDGLSGTTRQWGTPTNNSVSVIVVSAGASDFVKASISSAADISTRLSTAQMVTLAVRLLQDGPFQPT